jgi:hypothetical protein
MYGTYYLLTQLSKGGCVLAVGSDASENASCGTLALFTVLRPAHNTTLGWRVVPVRHMIVAFVNLR